MIQIDHVKDAIRDLSAKIEQVDRDFDMWVEYGDDMMNPDWSIEKCYLILLSIMESMQLVKLREMFQDIYAGLKSGKGLSEISEAPDGQPYSIPISKLRQYKAVVEAFLPISDGTTVRKDLIQAIRDVHYVIADETLFGHPPRNETDVHLRIEAVLKPFFPDLKHKPSLTKSIKNFQPDTGIGSISTLIEYKFLAKKQDVPTVADQILADTRGYVSTEWKRIIYVIYETNRFRTEKDWNNFLKESGIREDTIIIVLSGEPPKTGQKDATGVPA